MKLILTTILGAVLTCWPVFANKADEGKALDTHNDAAFLRLVAQADMTNAHIGEEAEDRAVTAPLKDFARTVVQDHRGDYTAVSQLASKLGETIPKAIDDRDVHTILALDHYKGKTYDKMLLQREIEEHEKLVKAYKSEAENGQNDQIKSYAKQALPAIEKHLQEARELLRGKS